MVEDLKIALIQTDLVWEQPQANISALTQHIEAIREAVDLIVLPEMFSTGFTMNAQAQAETMDGPTVTWMQNQALSKQTAILGSLVITENEQYFNRLVFVYPNGEITTYDKRHTFTLAGEDKVYTTGETRVITYYKGWRLFPLICYDLRFPVWSRFQDDYDVLLYVANWPKPRIQAWDTLLRARAIENMSFSIGVNRVGTDAKGHEYVGHSAVYNPLGEVMSSFLPKENGIRIVVLHHNELVAVREQFKFLDDRDAFNLLM
ncbi:amidohydrolase [Formosa sp. A9]|uniref:amidohydrolase n=1 Tax=Formosa sp. A9 TaxID=3442641 RepID=UPI003EBA60AB